MKNWFYRYLVWEFERMVAFVGRTPFSTCRGVGSRHRRKTLFPPPPCGLVKLG